MFIVLDLRQLGIDSTYSVIKDISLFEKEN